ncbi:MAG: hypothetical protein JXA69_03930 [Phycisphaerae bacterium]|nr:hypothetical protein [Phycisphaerae bacterium]
MAPTRGIIVVIALFAGSGCAPKQVAPVTASEFVGQSPPAHTPHLLFNRDGSAAPTIYYQEDTYGETNAPRWEIIRFYSNGVQRTTAVRRRGDATDYYTSTTSPDSTQAQNRVVSRSSSRVAD